MKKIIFGIACACAAVSSAAQEAPRSERVSYADLDLQSAAGKAALETRIRGAAERVCLDNGVQDLRTRLAGHECFNSALANGLSQMDRQIAGRAGSSVAASTLIITAN